MKIEIIVIASEVLQGKIFEKNANWLAKKLLSLGHELAHLSVIPDKSADIQQAFKLATQRSDLIITSGGLGPTLDDLTKFELANFFNLKINPCEKSLQLCRDHYQRVGRIYEEKNYHYHQIPDGFETLYNRAGLAPGLKYEFNKNKFVLCAPGVPREFITILEDQLPSLLRIPEKIIKLYTVKTFKVPESKIFTTVEPGLWQKLEQFGDVSSLPNYGGVDIGVKLIDTKEEIAKKEKELNKLFLNSNLRPNIYYIGTKLLEEIIIEKALKLKIKFGFAESCTGGLNSSRITDISGASSVFWGSVIAYDNQIKIDQLNVEKNIIENNGAVSEECAKSMARGLREKFKLDYAISTTGIAGPTGGSTEKPVGTVFIGFANEKENFAVKYNFTGDREQLKLRFSQSSLFLLLEKLMVQAPLDL